MSKRAPSKELDRYSVNDEDDFGEEEPKNFQSEKADWKADQKELTARTFSIPKGRGSGAVPSVNPFASFSVPVVDLDSNLNKKKHGLNKSFINYVNDLYAKNPCVDLRGAFERYSSHWATFEPVGKANEKALAKPFEKTIEKPEVKQQEKFAFHFEKQPIQFGQQKPSITLNQETPAASSEKAAFTFNQDKAASTEKAAFSFTQQEPIFKFNQEQQQPAQEQPFKFQFNQEKPTFAFQAPQDKSSSTAEAISPFKAATFNLFSNSTSTFSFQPQSSASSFSMPSSKEDQEQNDDENQDVDEEEPKEHFEVIKPAQEEGKEILFEKRCKLFLFKDNEYKDKGVSELRLMRDTATGKNILLARMEVSGNITLNSMLNNNCKATPPTSGKKDVIVLCFDANGKLSNHLLRFKSFEEAQECYQSISSALQ
jgi:hypothetical protein